MMSVARAGGLVEVLREHEKELLADWLKGLTAAGSQQSDRITEREWREQCGMFLALLRQAIERTNGTVDIQRQEWGDVRAFLEGISRTRTQQGFSPSETATFIFSLKRPIFAQLKKALAHDGESAAGETWSTTELLDRLGLFTIDTSLKTRDSTILRQQEEMLELSTPVVKLWDGILALPMIGTLDSARTQVVMETLLQKIVATGADLAIIDITGVPTVDTLVAQHLIKTITAARLMGAECIISGIRPQIAQTIVHLGVDLGDIISKANLADAFALALDRRGLAVCRRAPKPGA
jgi:rsbT co-antagonist protein RsbR